jgi:thiol-disulfide isomerase/thioredoxin
MIIQVINQRNIPKFEKSINKGIWFVWYYAEWCGHCKNMEQEWKDFSTKPPKGINVAKIESTIIPQMKNDPGVVGYPTIKLYNNGNEVTNYDGERTAKSFKNFLTDFVKNAKPKSEHIHPSHLSENINKYKNLTRNLDNNDKERTRKPTVVRVPLNNNLNPKLENAIQNSVRPIDMDRNILNVNSNSKITELMEHISQPKPYNENKVITKTLFPSKDKSKTLAQIIDNVNGHNNNRKTKTKIISLNSNNLVKSLREASKRSRLNNIPNHVDNHVNNHVNNHVDNHVNNHVNNDNEAKSIKVEISVRNSNGRKSRTVSLPITKKSKKSSRKMKSKTKSKFNRRSMRKSYKPEPRDSFFADSGEPHTEAPEVAPELEVKPGLAPNPGQGMGRGIGRKKRRGKKGKGRGRGAPLA